VRCRQCKCSLVENPSFNSSKCQQVLPQPVIKQQVTEGGCPPLRETAIQPMEEALNQPTFLTQAQALLGKTTSERVWETNEDQR